jgi:hypothetical protein
MVYIKSNKVSNFFTVTTHRREKIKKRRFIKHRYMNYAYTQIGKVIREKFVTRP